MKEREKKFRRLMDLVHIRNGGWMDGLAVEG